MSSILNNHVIGRCPLSAGQPDIVRDNKNYCIKNVLALRRMKGDHVSENEGATLESSLVEASL